MSQETTLLAKKSVKICRKKRQSARFLRRRLSLQEVRAALSKNDRDHVRMDSMSPAERVCQNSPKGQSVDLAGLAIDNLASGRD